MGATVPTLASSTCSPTASRSSACSTLRTSTCCCCTTASTPPRSPLPCPAPSVRPSIPCCSAERACYQRQQPQAREGGKRVNLLLVFLVGWVWAVQRLATAGVGCSDGYTNTH